MGSIWRRQSGRGAAWPRLGEWLSSGHLVDGSASVVVAPGQRSSFILQGSSHLVRLGFGHVAKQCEVGKKKKTAGGVEAEEASGGQISNYVPHSATECKSSIKISISRGVFEGTINYDCIFTIRYGGRLFTGSRL